MIGLIKTKIDKITVKTLTPAVEESSQFFIFIFLFFLLLLYLFNYAILSMSENKMLLQLLQAF